MLKRLGAWSFLSTLFNVMRPILKLSNFFGKHVSLVGLGLLSPPSSSELVVWAVRPVVCPFPHLLSHLLPAHQVLSLHSCDVLSCLADTLPLKH